MAFPTTTHPASMTLRSHQPTLVSTTHSLTRQVRSRGGQRWGFALQYRSLSRALLSELIGFAIAQRGQYSTFSFTPAVLGYPQSTVSGTPLVNGAHVSGRSIVTDGWANSVTAMKAGEFVKFGGHAKVYMLTADVTSDGSGNATLAIEPALMSSLANNEAITVTAVPFTVAFVQDTHDVSVAPKPVFDWSCELVEVP